MAETIDVINKIERMSKRMRKLTLDLALEAGASSSHLGGGLSIIDITATLYGAVMSYDPSNPEWIERDRFILSKGHGVLGLYTALYEAGFISKDELLTFEKSGSFLAGHPIINREKGIEFSNGSLGMGLSLGIGVALAGKLRNINYRVFVLIGDGECNEGSIWEAAQAGAHYELDNLITIIDRNNFQQTGANKDIMSIGDIASKWRSFGWETEEIEGHDIKKIYDSLTKNRTKGKPFALIAHTIKGKGISFAENNNDWHHATLTKSLYDQAVEEMNDGGKAR